MVTFSASKEWQEIFLDTDLVRSDSVQGRRFIIMQLCEGDQIELGVACDGGHRLLFTSEGLLRSDGDTTQTQYVLKENDEVELLVKEDLLQFQINHITKMQLKIKEYLRSFNFVLRGFITHSG